MNLSHVSNPPKTAVSIERRVYSRTINTNLNLVMYKIDSKGGAGGGGPKIVH